MIAGELHLGFVEEVVDEPDAWRLAELCNTVGEVGRGHRRLSTEGGEEKSHIGRPDRPAKGLDESRTAVLI